MFLLFNLNFIVLAEDITPIVDIGEEKSIWNLDIVEPEESNNFIRIMMPAALADSINPCAFAVMLILLASILKKTSSRRKATLAGIIFALTIFVMYFLMWLWLSEILNTASDANANILKRVVWILWIIVWLANLKDFFLPDVWRKMEVPEARKPNMQKITSSITSPLWAVGIWIVISLFLLPCTSWPYITILAYMKTQALAMQWYMYLLIYNLIFVLPMIAIVILVWIWAEKVEKIARMRKSNLNILHLIVWLLMLWLWLYVILDVMNLI